MNLANLFTRGGTMPATTEPETTAERLKALQARLAEVSRRVASGEATEVEYLEESDLRARVIAAAQANEVAQARANRAALAARIADYDARVDKTMTTIGGLVAQLLFALQDKEALVAEAYTGVGNGRHFEDIFGVPEAFARDVRQAILDAAPAAQWHYDVCAGGAPKRPTSTVYVQLLPPAHVRDVNGHLLGTNQYI